MEKCDTRRKKTGENDAQKDIWRKRGENSLKKEAMAKDNYRTLFGNSGWVLGISF